MKKKAIICDLDGTLSNAEHRKHFVQAKKWDAFYEALDQDPMNQWCYDLIWAMRQMFRTEIIFVSGRPEKYREKTFAWMDRQRVFNDRILFMRKDGDYRQDAIIKTEIYKAHIEPHYEVKFCIDDRQQVVDAWRALGLVCLQCDEGAF